MLLKLDFKDFVADILLKDTAAETIQNYKQLLLLFVEFRD